MVLIIPNFQDAHGQSLADLPEVWLAKMLQQADEPVELAFLQSSLTLKRDLQRLGLQDIVYWSAFADLQQVDGIEGLPLTLYDFPFTDGLDPFFINGENRVLLYRDGVLEMEIVVHHQLEVEQVVYYRSDGSREINYYSDDGFLSTKTWINNNNQTTWQEWYTPLRQLVFWMDAEQIFHVSPEFQSQFAQSTYANLELMIQERFEQHFHKPTNVIAAYRAGVPATNRFHLSLPAERMVALLEPAIHLDQVNQLRQQLPQVNWVFPSHNLVQQFQAEYESKEDQRLSAIEPYPTSFSPGLSNEFEAQFVYWQVVGQSEEQIEQAVNSLLPKLLSDDKLVLLITGDANSKQLLQLKQQEWILTHLKVDVLGSDYQRYVTEAQPHKFQTEAEWLDFIDNQIMDDDAALDDDDLRLFYRANLFANQFQFIEEQDDDESIFQKIRLFIDMGTHADLKKQIQAISAAVPIISTVPTDLIHSGKNGFLNRTIAALPTQLDYFLKDLHHWNQAVVDSVDLMEEYEQDQIIKRWKGVLNHG
ncbi:accessory Sec system protein Asp1 [Fructilactobacillus cliffordii]|uniref:Accessory Sec system protein Asp1 n=1 Tax=Fructilactobacillus cliffordii TaxID=2940299 RepID=A0A9Q8ZRU9_9LACO|nr:accessory Sec system protein Asp1 [Fructilactobacillus cliffordii]USS88648.1 accessory Sec system protein Asp1 [Fructilactobacillus cliffordii]